MSRSCGDSLPLSLRRIFNLQKLVGFARNPQKSGGSSRAPRPREAFPGAEAPNRTIVYLRPLDFLPRLNIWSKSLRKPEKQVLKKPTGNALAF